MTKTQSHRDAYIRMAAACQALRLMHREKGALRQCFHARMLVSNGHMLLTPSFAASVDRLVARDYLTKIEFNMQGLGVVALLSQDNFNLLIGDANTAIKQLLGVAPG